MNKKGFTLVELLGVLIIMAIIMVVVVTPIIGQIRNTSKKLDEAALKVLYASTSSYLDENKSSYPKDDGMVYYISIGQLIDSDMLSSNYLSSYSEEVLSRNNAIKVFVEDGGYHYVLADSSEDLSTLFNAYQNVENDSTYNYIRGTYFSGSADNNYVYYSGFMWRIMGINEDGSIKLITDEPITTLKSGGSIDYQYGYINEWLNNYFISRLKYSDYLVDQALCHIKTSDSSLAEDKCASIIKENLINAKVSQLSLYEYNFSYLNDVTYLNNSFIFSTSTDSLTDQSQIYAIAADGTVIIYDKNNMQYVRPVISLMPESTITSGSGTNSNPYILFKSQTTISESNNRTLNSLNLADGEYVNLNSKIYRVVENDDSEVKLILNDLYEVSGVDYSSSFGSSSTFDINEGLAGYLKNTLYLNEYSDLNGVVKTKFWYQGESTYNGLYYKTSSLAKANIVYDVNVGLPKIGEILTAPIYGVTTNKFWTISMSRSTSVYTVSSSETIETVVSSTAFLRPVIIVAANSLVSGGIGTSSSPYIIKY